MLSTDPLDDLDLVERVDEDMRQLQVAVRQFFESNNDTCTPIKKV